MNPYEVGQEIMYTYRGVSYADEIAHVSATYKWVSTKHNQHFVDMEEIITPPMQTRSITPVTRKTAEQLMQEHSKPRQPTPDLRTAYEESLVSLVDAYELNRLHEQISEMHRAHAIDLALDANDAERFKQLTEGAWSS